MKILHLPDLHCFYPTYGTVSEKTGSNSRFDEWVDAIRQTQAIARREKVDLVVAPGDFFRNNHPHALQYIAVADAFEGFEKLRMPVVGDPGNHDAGKPGQVTPCRVISRMGKNNWNISEPSVVMVKGIAIAVLPYRRFPVPEGGGIEDRADLAASALADDVRRLAAECPPEAKHRILMGHWAVSGAQASSGQILDWKTEPTIPLDVLKETGWEAVCLGHIHKPQVLCQAPFIGYAGALQRVDFSEENDQRGVWIHDLSKGTSTWHEIDVMRFRTVRLGPEASRRIVEDHESPVPEQGVDGCVVRVQFEATEDVAKRLDWGAMRQVLKEAGATSVESVSGAIRRTERSREGIREDTSPIEAMTQWLQGRAEMGEEVRADVLSLAEKVLAEIRAEDLAQ
jgi:DNA repair exonuclease SbcCD nuclease subunit